MSRDTLSDVLRAVRLRGAVFYYIDGNSPWAAEAPPALEIIPAILPGAEHMIEFHAVAEGSCWAGIVGEPPLYLEQGDVILFPQGDPHVVSSAPGLRPPAAEANTGVYYAPRPPQLPFALTLCDADGATARLDGGGCDRSTLVCGFLGLDARPFNPLLASLPRVLHLSGAARDADSWVASFLRGAVSESNRRRPGGEAVLERMSEMLFVEALRRYVDSLPDGQTGWLAGMRDPSVGLALALLHQSPGLPWTLERLAEETAMSRSTLHDRFVHFIGQPPMQYLARWRMQVASVLLRDTKAKVVEAAFSRAFKRAVGAPPVRGAPGPAPSRRGVPWPITHDPPPEVMHRSGEIALPIHRDSVVRISGTTTHTGQPAEAAVGASRSVPADPSTRWRPCQDDLCPDRTCT